MKIALLVLIAAASVLRLPAAIPLSWTVETSRAQPATFEAYQGETLTFEAALQAHGKPLEAPLSYSFFWQTNSMGNAYWEVSCPSSATTTNVLFATWLPAYDVGAKVYNCFIGSPSNIYHAAFQLRLRPSPGALPNALPLPTPVIDFARVRVLNPPWPGGGGGVDTNAVIDIANATIATNPVVAAARTLAGEALDLAVEAETHAQMARNAASAAQSTADQAVTDAATAQSTAEAAQTTAAAAQSTADQAAIDAASAQATADQAAIDAASAQSTADQASIDAANAQSTAEQAANDSAEAKQSASSASASVQQLAGQVNTIGAHLNAEDARFVSTNYNSATHMPEAYVEIKLPDQSWAVIWREMTRWNWLFDTWVPANLYSKSQVDAALDQKADRAFGYYDSHSGTYAPDGYTWLSSPKVALAAGLGYQRTVTAEGAIWVLESNGLVTETGGVASNGFFRISDDEGNVHFEIVKGNRRTIGADASSCQVVAGFSPTKLQIGYSVISDAHPTLRICNDLNTQQWKDETDPDCLANVTWEGQSGAWVAYMQGKAAQSALFVKATYETGAESYIRNVAPVSMEFMYLGGQKFAVGTATISGHTVLTLTPAN